MEDQWLITFQSVCLLFSQLICMRCVIRMDRALDDLRSSLMRIEMAHPRPEDLPDDSSR